MGAVTQRDLDFELAFAESLLRRDPMEPRAVEMLAHLYTQVGRIDEGLVLDERLVSLEPGNASAHYNLACSLSLKDRIDEAFASLARAFECGYEDVAWMRKDPDLKALRSDPRWKALTSAR